MRCNFQTELARTEISCVYFPGSTIGNLSNSDADRIALTDSPPSVANTRVSSGSILPKKDAGVLTRSLQRFAKGVTAAFPNLTCSDRINRDGRWRSLTWINRTFLRVYNTGKGSHRKSRYSPEMRAKEVKVGELITVPTAGGEEIHTEYITSTRSPVPIRWPHCVP